MSTDQFTSGSPLIRSAKRKSSKKQTDEMIQIRRQQMIDMKVKGHTDKQISDEFGLSLQHTQREIRECLKMTNKQMNRQANKLRSLLLHRYENLYNLYYPKVESSVLNNEDMNYQNNVPFDNIMRVMKEMRDLIGTDPDKQTHKINNTQQNLIVNNVGEDDPRERLYSRIVSIRERASNTIAQDNR